MLKTEFTINLQNQLNVINLCLYVCGKFQTKNIGEISVLKMYKDGKALTRYY